MSAPDEHPVTTIHNLIGTLESYQGLAERSTDLAQRWLAHRIGPLLHDLRLVRSNNPSDNMVAAMKEFRAGELRAQLESKRKEVTRIEQELKRMAAA